MLLIALVGARGGAVQSDATRPAVHLHVSAVQINEARDTDTGGPRWGPSQVVLEVTGEPLKRAVAFAHFRVEQAIDDAGENLVDSDDSELRHNTYIHVTQPVRRTDGVPSIRVSGFIHTPSKRTTKLVRLKGRVQVMTLGEESQSVVIPRLASYFTQKPAIKELDRKKLWVESNLYFDWHNSSKDFDVRLGGNPAIVRKLQIFDADGQLLRNGHLSDDYNVQDSREVTFFAMPRPPDDKMSMKIEFAASQKVITVRFDLKDIPLP